MSQVSDADVPIRWHWDGWQWRPISADGNHWWDGWRWRPLSVSTYPKRWPLPWLIALGTIAAVVLALFGIGLGVELAGSHSSGIQYSQPFFAPGGAVSSGDAGCGEFRVGPSLAAQDCLKGPPNPAFEIGQPDQSGELPEASLPSPGPDGCVLQSTSATKLSEITTVGVYRAPLIMVVDFTPKAWVSGAAAVLFWWDASPGADVALQPLRGASNDFLIGDDDRALVNATSVNLPLRVGTAYRLILRVTNVQIEAWLNGSKLGAAASNASSGPGHVSFTPGGNATVDVTRIQVLGSA